LALGSCFEAISSFTNHGIKSKIFTADSADDADVKPASSRWLLAFSSLYEHAITSDLKNRLEKHDSSNDAGGKNTQAKSQKLRARY
jgi:hypothetical protein